MSAAPAWPREAERQQQLLRALWRRDADAPLTAWVQGDAAVAAQGLSAYRGNAAAIAERALAAAYPTLQQLLGEESFESLARALWHRHPPKRGDLAHWGQELAAFVEADAQLAGEPYLADVARLEWVVHRLEHAADAPAVPDGLSLLASEDPAALGLQFQAGATLLVSRWPVGRVWQAHRMAGAEGLAAVQAAFAAGEGDSVWIWRDGWRATVQTVDGPTERFLGRLLAGGSLGAALNDAGEAFDFAAWLGEAVARRWLVAVRSLAGATTEAGH